MKRSLMLCASITLLAPLTLAMVIKDVDFSLNFGNRTVTIGDRTDTDTNLLGDVLTTSTVTTAGTTTAVAHSIPTGILEVGATVPIFGNYGIRVAFETQVSSTDTHTVYDGKSKTAVVTMDAHSAVLASDGLAGDTDYVGSFGISSISSGQRKLTVAHQTTVGGKILYSSLQDSHNAGIGLSLLWTNDIYRYTVDLAPSGSGSGVFSATTNANNFAMPAFSTATSAPTITDATKSTATYTPTAGTTGEYDDRLLWVGLIAEGSSDINENIAVKGGLGYYIREFAISPDATISTPMVVKASDATMYVGHIGLTLKTSLS